MHDSTTGQTDSQDWSSGDNVDHSSAIGELGLPQIMVMRLRTLLECVQKAISSEMVEQLNARTIGYLDAVSDAGHETAAAYLYQLFDHEINIARKRVPNE